MSIDSQYNNNDFKRFFIDLDTLTQLIRGIGQLKTLQKLDNSVQLNKNITKLANSAFKIRNIALNRSINLNISLKLISFYIIPINTLFLLFFANMDNHKTFFNHITNQIIQL